MVLFDNERLNMKCTTHAHYDENTLCPICQNLGSPMPKMPMAQPAEAQLKEIETQMKGLKFDSDKLDWSLLPLEPTEEVVKVLMFGAKKYAPGNWKKVDDHERRYYNAAMRHLTAWQKGEKIDSETGISHLAHSICCLLFILGRENE